MAAGKIVDAQAPEASGRQTTSGDSRRRRARARRPGGDGRWVREVKGILALALAGFGLVALYAFDPTRHPLDQSSPVGPVGLWLGWAAFWAFGYAGYVFPLLLIVYGAGAFVRAPLARGWPGLAGLALLLISVTSILARRSDTLAEIRIHNGGMLGWAVGEALATTVGSVGSWIILLAILPVAALFITQASLGGVSRLLRARLAAWRARRDAAPGTGARSAADTMRPAPPERPEKPFTPPPLIVKEPPK